MRVSVIFIFLYSLQVSAFDFGGFADESGNVSDGPGVSSDHTPDHADANGIAGGFGGQADNQSTAESVAESSFGGNSTGSESGQGYGGFDGGEGGGDNSDSNSSAATGRSKGLAASIAKASHEQAMKERAVITRALQNLNNAKLDVPDEHKGIHHYGQKAFYGVMATNTVGLAKGPAEQFSRTSKKSFSKEEVESFKKADQSYLAHDDFLVSVPTNSSHKSITSNLPAANQMALDYSVVALGSYATLSDVYGPAKAFGSNIQGVLSVPNDLDVFGSKQETMEKALLSATAERVASVVANLSEPIAQTAQEIEMMKKQGLNQRSIYSPEQLALAKEANELAKHMMAGVQITQVTEITKLDGKTVKESTAQEIAKIDPTFSQSQTAVLGLQEVYSLQSTGLSTDQKAAQIAHTSGLAVGTAKAIVEALDNSPTMDHISDTFNDFATDLGGQ